MKKILFAVSALVFVLFSSSFSLVQATSFGGLGIRPANSDPANPLTESWFVYNLLPGETKSDACVVSNTSDKVMTAKLYPVDGTTTSDGSFALLEEKQDRKDVGAWLQLVQNQITLNPGEEKIVSFTIALPPDTTVGDHLGGIILENLDVSKGKGVNVVTRVGVRIYETVPGELVRKLTLVNLSWKLVKNKPTLYFDFKNEGNVHLTPKGKVIIKDGFLGLTLASYDVNLGMVLPGKPTQIPLIWQKSWLLGKFTALAEITYGDKPSERIEQEVGFSYIKSPAKTVFVFLGGLLVLLFLRPLLVRRKK